MANNKNRLELGLWADDDFEQTVREHLGIGADQDVPEEIRFKSRVAKIIRRRSLEAARSEPDPPKLGIFLLQPTPRRYTGAMKPKRVPMLSNGLTAVAGRLWFVNAVVSSGYYIDLEHDDDELFHIISNTLLLGDVPAITFDPRPHISEVRFFPAGVNNLDFVEIVEVSFGDISLQQIYEEIDTIYRKHLVTPDAQLRAAKLWKDSQKGWPSDKAEDLIQNCLHVGLTRAFPNCTVRAEQPSPGGRLDILVEEPHPEGYGQIIVHAILELKVLRSFGSGGIAVREREVSKWIESGVIQAAEYRRDRHALASALCCFDMRRSSNGEQCFEHVKELAKEQDVDLKLWVIYQSSKQYREASVGLNS